MDSAEKRRQEHEEHVKRVEAFHNRKFSGTDVIMIMEQAGIGVGATIHICEQIDINRKRTNYGFREWTYPPDEA